jgi:hypothetical protein
VYWPECLGEIRSNPSSEPVLDDSYNYAPKNEADWPDLHRHRKRECLEAIHKGLEERYPGGSDRRDDG